MMEVVEIPSGWMARQDFIYAVSFHFSDIRNADEFR